MDIVEIYKKIEHKTGKFLISMISPLKKKKVLKLDENHRHSLIDASIQNPKKILIIKFFGFGNFILMSPLIKSLKENGVEVHVLTTHLNKGIVECYGHIIDKAYFIEFKRFIDIPINAVINLNKFWKEKYDVVIDAEYVLTATALLSFLINPKYIIGYRIPSIYKYKLFDVAIDYNDNRHVVFQYLRFLDVFGIKYKNPSLEKIPYTDEDKKFVDNYLLSKNIKDDDILIYVHPTVGFQNKLRIWDKYDKLIEELIKMDNIKVIVGGAKSEKEELNKYIIDKNKVISIIGWNFRKISYLFDKKVKAGVCGDTGILHLMASCNTYVVGLFGPSNPKNYGPFTVRKKIIQKKLDCAPCMVNSKPKLVNCNNNIQCMKSINVEEVLNAIMEGIK